MSFTSPSVVTMYRVAVACLVSKPSVEPSCYIAYLCLPLWFPLTNSVHTLEVVALLTSFKLTLFHNLDITVAYYCLHLTGIMSCHGST